MTTEPPRISAILDAMRNSGEIPKPFWTEGEIAASIEGNAPTPVTRKRQSRLRQFLLSNGHPCHDDELRALCLREQAKGLPAKIPVLAFKYLLLKEEEGGGGTWTLEADRTAELLAKGIVRKHKEE